MMEEEESKINMEYEEGHKEGKELDMTIELVEIVKRMKTQFKASPSQYRSEFSNED